MGGVFPKWKGFGSAVYCQSIEQTLRQGEIHGNLQMDAQYYNPDSAIGAPPVPEKILMNGFSNINYTNQNFSAGIRYESYLNALQGFPSGYRGSGFPYRYASFTNKNLTVTAGNYYEQFGSGLIFRSYEERGLGYDNAMDGLRIFYRPYSGIYMKGLIGKMRKYFTYGEGILRGTDIEINVNELFSHEESGQEQTLVNNSSDSSSISQSINPVITGKENKIKFIFGGSAISKYEKDQNSTYNLPENVAAFAGRANLIYNGFSLFSEYAYKMNDPYPYQSGSVYDYNYKPGQAFLTQASYSKPGFGISLSAKRTDNMDFRTDRNAKSVPPELLINYMPPLTRQHTYNLLATLYPYASQSKGEMAFQGELIYKLKKETFLGGKRGANILINVSMVNNIDTIHLNDMDTTRIGYRSDFFKIGRDTYFKDFNIEFSKKITDKLKMILTYANLAFNIDVIQGKVNKGMIYSDVGILEIQYKISKKHSIRSEIQNLITKKDQGDWATGILEYSYSPNWFLAVMDQYNYGNKDSNKRIHYYFFSLGYTLETTRFIINYGKQRAGIFCVGGVCRNVPASNGISLTILSSF